jgi:hypothetical protein
MHIFYFQLYRLLNKFVFTGLGCQPNVQPPTWITRVSLLVWNLTLDLSGLGDTASSYATAGIALEIIGARKPHRHDIYFISACGTFWRFACMSRTVSVSTVYTIRLPLRIQCCELQVIDSSKIRFYSKTTMPIVI